MQLDSQCRGGRAAPAKNWNGVLPMMEIRKYRMVHAYRGHSLNSRYSMSDIFDCALPFGSCFVKEIENAKTSLD